MLVFSKVSPDGTKQQVGALYAGSSFFNVSIMMMNMIMKMNKYDAYENYDRDDANLRTLRTLCRSTRTPLTPPPSSRLSLPTLDLQ